MGNIYHWGKCLGVHVWEGYVLEPVSDSLSLRLCDAVVNDGRGVAFI